MPTAFIQYYDSPCGEMILSSVNARLCLCDWNDSCCSVRNMRRLRRLLNVDFKEKETEILLQTKNELDEYFAGERTAFNIPLQMVGTDFQKSVWQALADIPYGHTNSYLEIARQINRAKAVRAVAQAIGANGISVLIPCHRVVGSDHSLTGYSGGVERKKKLLHLEGVII